MRFFLNSENKLIPVSTGEIQYACGGNNKSGIRSRQVPVWRGLISIVLSVIHSGSNNKHRAQKIKSFCSSSLWTCSHQMVILLSQNKITDFLMILA